MRDGVRKKKWKNIVQKEGKKKTEIIANISRKTEL